MKTDEQLILEYQEGSQEALEELYGRYKLAILNYALRFLGQRADAEDALSEVFMTIVLNKMSYRPIAKFSTWLYRVAHNISISRLRRNKFLVSTWAKNDETGDYDQWEIEDKKDLPREELIKKETRKMVKKSIHKLPSDQKEALILREYQELPYDEIAQIMDITLENVKILIFRAREFLKNELASFITEDNR